MVLGLLCGNGDKSRTQRKIMQDASLVYLGSHSDDHKVSQVMTVINYCSVDISMEKTKLEIEYKPDDADILEMIKEYQEEMAEEKLQEKLLEEEEAKL